MPWTKQFYLLGVSVHYPWLTQHYQGDGHHRREMTRQFAVSSSTVALDHAHRIVRKHLWHVLHLHVRRRAHWARIRAGVC